MTIQQFIEKYLPDFDEKWKEYKEQDFYFDEKYEGDLHLDFSIHYFDEALANYTKIVCEKQKEIIANCFSPEWGALRKGVMESPQPNMEDNL